MKSEFQKLLELAFSDGVLTEAENNLLLKKAKQLGMDEIEAELIIANYSPTKAEPPKMDGYDITNEELIQRLTRYSSHLTSVKAEIQMDPFPMLIDDSNKISKGLSNGKKILAGALKGDLLSDSLAVAGKFAPIPGGKIGGKLMGKGVSALARKAVGAEVKKLSQKEIIELVESYLIILEMRKDSNEMLGNKYTEITQKIISAKANPAKRKGLFG